MISINGLDPHAAAVALATYLRTSIIAWLAFIACSMTNAAPPSNAPSIPGFRALAGPLSQSDGKVVYAGYAYHVNGSGFAFAVARVNADHTPDAAFGAGGMVRVPIWGDYEYANAVLLQPDGKIVIGGSASDPATGWMCDDPSDCALYTALARLDGDGALDVSFNASGKIVFLNGDLKPGTGQYEGYLQSLALEADGKVAILYDGIFHVAEINPDGTLHESPPGVLNHEVDFVTVIEYHAAEFDHYFLASDPSEAASLDNTPGGAWKRTGFGFHSYAAGKDGGLPGLPVCRLYGKRSPELNTHMFTADLNECVDLGHNYDDAWQLESRDAFRVAVPDTATGDCPRGQAPIYRLWAPRPDASHRYTASPTERDRMLAQGYVSEGYGPQRVAMCAAP